MPRTTKEKLEKKETKKEATTVEKKKTTSPKVAAKTTAKKETASKKTKTGTTKTAKATTTKAAKTTKKKTTTKTTKTKATTKTKKATEAHKSSSKTATKKRITPSIKPVPIQDFTISEYYDLPTSYQKTIVKLLAQTPTTLFVYWEISEEDRKKWEEQYGNDFMEKTRPVLIIHNETNNSSYETEINDFANCWYIHVPDSNCKYHIELGRRLRQVPNQTITLPHNYLYVSTSNEMDAPNDHVLFDTLQNNIYYRNVKTNEVTTKKVSELYFMKKIGNLATIRKLYERMYHTEDVSHIYDLANPSSQNPTSTFK